MFVIGQILPTPAINSVISYQVITFVWLYSLIKDVSLSEAR